MASSSKRGTKRQVAAENSGSELEEVSGAPGKKLCIICGGSPASIEKDSNYDAVMQLYWCTLGVDVKPYICRQMDSCAKCFEKIVKYFETNDIIVYFENYFKSLRAELLKKTVKGISGWEKEGIPLHFVQQEVRKKYGPDFKDMDERQIRSIKTTLEAYTVDCYEILDDDDNGESTSRKGMKITKNTEGADDKKPAKISLKTSNSKNEDSDDDD